MARQLRLLPAAVEAGSEFAPDAQTLDRGTVQCLPIASKKVTPPDWPEARAKIPGA